MSVLESSASASVGGISSALMVSVSEISLRLSSVTSSTTGVVGSRVGRGWVVVTRVGRGEGETGTTGLG